MLLKDFHLYSRPIKLQACKFFKILGNTFFYRKPTVAASASYFLVTEAVPIVHF